jgi:SAM-dependent methyltransferase
MIYQSLRRCLEPLRNRYPTFYFKAARQVMNIGDAIAFEMSELGLYMLLSARRFVSTYQASPADPETTRLLELHRTVRRILRTYRREYPYFKYCAHYPYQGLWTLGILGGRGTEDRFRNYQLDRWIKAEDTILDIGCNCGFMAIYCAMRTGCRADGVDPNGYMLNIGKACIEHLAIQNRVRLFEIPFEQFKPDRTYSVIFSFASHWTVDERHRPPLDDYMLRLHGLLGERGLLFFESHADEAGKADFHGRMERQRRLFTWEGSTMLDNGTREFFVLRKI